jgi:hypothetical protein
MPGRRSNGSVMVPKLRGNATELGAACADFRRRDRRVHRSGIHRRPAASTASTGVRLNRFFACGWQLWRGWLEGGQWSPRYCAVEDRLVDRAICSARAALLHVISIVSLVDVAACQRVPSVLRYH